MKQGKFITLEGGEGVGKSTNMSFIQHYIEHAGFELLLTREPGGTALGENIRQILLDTTYTDICDDSELLLMFAARAQHIQQVIQPALTQGKWVLCDRFTDATYAYQGGGRGIDASRITQLEQWVQGMFRPDLTILLDMSVTEGLARASARSEPDRFEQQQQEFFERVRQVYKQRASQNARQYKIIDASKNLDNVQSQLSAVLANVVNKVANEN